MKSKVLSSYRQLLRAQQKTFASDTKELMRKQADGGSISGAGRGRELFKVPQFENAPTHTLQALEISLAHNS